MSHTYHKRVVSNDSICQKGIFGVDFSQHCELLAWAFLFFIYIYIYILANLCQKKISAGSCSSKQSTANQAVWVEMQNFYTSKVFSLDWWWWMVIFLLDLCRIRNGVTLNGERKKKKIKKTETKYQPIECQVTTSHHRDLVYIALSFSN